MDTISRENNSMLPMAGVIVGVLALLVGGYAAVKTSSLQKQLAAQEEKVAKIDALESQLGSVAAAADKSAKDIASLSRTTQDAFNQVAATLTSHQTSIAKFEEAMKKPVATKGKSGEPVVAGPGEYVVKKGDSGASIARAHGASLSDLMAVNPDVNWNKMHVGQKIKLPKK